MSIDVNFSPYCKGDYCTHRLTARVDFERGYCEGCWQEKKEKDKKDE